MSLDDFLGNIKLTADITDAAFSGDSIDALIDRQNSVPLQGFPGFKLAPINGSIADIALLKDDGGNLELAGYYLGEALHILKKHRTSTKGMGLELIIATIPYRAPPNKNKPRIVTQSGLKSLKYAYAEARRRLNC